MRLSDLKVPLLRREAWAELTSSNRASYLTTELSACTACTQEKTISPNRQQASARESLEDMTNTLIVPPLSSSLRIEFLRMLD